MTATLEVRHRTPGRGGYKRGCRCDECWTAENAYRRARAGAEGTGRRMADVRAHALRRAVTAPRCAQSVAEPLPAARLPWDDLEEALRARWGVTDIAAIAERLGVWTRQIYRWRHDGLSWEQADVYAVRAGLHPVEVWGRASWFEGVDID
jgi:hypothetical protein